MPHASPPLDQAVRFYPVGSSATTFVIAGVTAETGAPETAEIAFWTSPDGVAWTESQGRSAGVVSAFAFDASGAGVAVGYFGSDAAIWNTTDGVLWTRLPDQAALLPNGNEAEIRLRHVARTDDGYIAIGETGPTTVILRSRDGLAWSRMPVQQELLRVTVEAIAAADGRFVILGHSRNPFRPGLWASSDGTAWSKVPDPPGFRVDRGRGQWSTGELVAGPSGWLLVDEGEPWQELWWSADGVDWADAEEPPGGIRQYGTQIAAAPWGFVATTYEGDCPSNVWASRDAEWTCSIGTPVSGYWGSWIAASDRVIVANDVQGPLWVAPLDP